MFKKSNLFLLALMIITALAFMYAIIDGNNQDAKVEPIPAASTIVRFPIGGDCHASEATGDTYLDETDKYCQHPSPLTAHLTLPVVNLYATAPAVHQSQRKERDAEPQDTSPNNPPIVTPEPPKEDNDTPDTPDKPDTGPSDPPEKDKHPNSGGGNGSEPDESGKDQDPGKSEEHNNGKD